jgi:hypothetical protein
MIVPVMNIGEVRVGVFYRLVYMRMGMRLLPVPVECMRMLVMYIVGMRVFGVPCQRQFGGQDSP